MNGYVHIAGEAISSGSMVYLRSKDGRIYRAEGKTGYIGHIRQDIPLGGYVFVYEGLPGPVSQASKEKKMVRLTEEEAELAAQALGTYILEHINPQVMLSGLMSPASYARIQREYLALMALQRKLETGSGSLGVERCPCCGQEAEICTERRLIRVLKETHTDGESVYFVEARVARER